MMKILIGIIKTTEKESQLLVLDKGEVNLINDEQPEKNFANYPFLKAHDFLINDNPVTGSGVFKFRYGPVTSGIKEAGSFHLYTYGEKILRATIDVGWKYRAMEESLKNRAPEEGLTMAEKVCGNFAFSHGLAFSQSVEKALNILPNLSTKNWRNLFLESERIYNHLHVIYKLAAAAAQKVLAAQLSALFEEALRLNDLMTGSRYLMNINNIGKLNHIPSEEIIESVAAGYRNLAEKFALLYKQSMKNHNYLDRLHTTGAFTAEQAQQWGLTGPSLRACGVKDGMQTIGHLISLPVITHNEGDSLARMEIRGEEIINSCQYIVNHLNASDSWNENVKQEISKHKEGMGYSIVNSPSGALGYYLSIKENKIKEMKIFTPSYVGMYAVSQALEGMIFTDFPFVYDSFGIHFTDAAC